MKGGAKKSSKKHSKKTSRKSMKGGAKKSSRKSSRKSSKKSSKKSYKGRAHVVPAPAIVQLDTPVPPMMSIYPQQSPMLGGGVDAEMLGRK